MTRFVTTRRVEFGDTDMAGIMHFSNFFRFMEVAETAFLRSRNLTVSWNEDGVHHGFPRVSVACDFKQPVRFEDLIEIEVMIEKIGRKSLSYRFDFRRGETEIATGRLTSVYCRSTPHGTMESLEIPPAMRSQLEA